MKSSIFTAIAIAAAGAALGLPASAPKADSAADFYQGKTVQIYVGVSPGGIYSTSAQLLARHMNRHLAGHPTMVVQHMRGAGGTKALNYVYNVAPHDGSVVMVPNSGIDKRVLLKVGNPKYDPTKFHWLGGWGEPVNTLTVRNDAPAKTFKEALKTQLILGAIGKSSSTYMIPSLLQNVLGAKFKIITGYRGGSPIRLAIESGELHGWAGQWLGWKLAKPDWVRDGKIIHLMQMASKRAPDLPNVPLLSEFARNDEERMMFAFVQTNLSDRAFVAPPGVPGDRVAALGKAYQATLRDPAFVAEAAKHQFHIDPIDGAAIQAHVEQMMKMPKATVEKLRRAMGLIK